MLGMKHVRCFRIPFSKLELTPFQQYVNQVFPRPSYLQFTVDTVACLIVQQCSKISTSSSRFDTLLLSSATTKL